MPHSGVSEDSECAHINLKKKKEVKSELSQHGHNSPPIPFLRLSELGKHLTPHTDFLRFSPKKVGKETGCGDGK